MPDCLYAKGIIKLKPINYFLTNIKDIYLMKRVFFRTLIPVFLFVAAVPAVMAQRMTDEQVTQYVKSGIEAGKTESQIASELIGKGATQSQLKKLKINVALKSSAGDSQPMTQNDDKQRDPVEEEISVTANRQGTNNATAGGTGGIYGRSLFTNPNLTFEPNENAATPQDYRLGPGDEVVIDIWGVNEDHIRQTISPEGSIMISQVGPLYLNGMTISDANKYVRDAFSSKYSGITGENPDSDINVRLGNIRTIQVNVMGEVSVPGTYRLSPFSSVFHALYNAGGISSIGSLRDVEVIRNGKTFRVIDVYDYLFKGKQSDNIRLQEGDIVRVAPYGRMVKVNGNVKRPMYYEMLPGESLSQLIAFAGGFTGDAYKEQVSVARQSNKENEFYNVKDVEFETYQLADGDVVTVASILDRFSNRVEISGSIMRPGLYAISDEVKTIKDLIKKAEGLKEDAYLTRALLYREAPDLSIEVIPVDLRALMSGFIPDIALSKNDRLIISSVNEIIDRGPVSIMGLVANPGTYPYAENMTVEDLILRAGGLLQGASRVRIDVSRRIVDNMSLQTGDVMAKLFTVEIQDDLVIDPDKEFLLEPYDIVEVRKSPSYQTQRRVYAGGELTFEGGFTLESKNERISDLVKRAGGLTPHAYLKGATLVRQMTEDEVAARDQLMTLVTNNENGEDSISSGKVISSNRYNVGIELEDILKNPGSDIDLVLREGDVLFVPEFNNTVKISGDVMFPNTVTYKAGKKLDYYVNQAGGYGSRAKKSKAFIIYMNGTVSQIKRGTQIEPGSHIIIPSKQSKSVNWQAILSVASMAGTLGTMSAAIANLCK